MHSKAVRDALLSHVRSSWPDRRHDDFRWVRGPVEDVLQYFSVRRIAPLSTGDGYLYLSVGAFDVGEEPMREFFIMSSAESPRHVETLAMVAHYHSSPRHRLTHGSVLNIGRPWAEGSDKSHLLVSWPYSLDARSAVCTVGGKGITYLWLIPISAKEANFAKRVGVERLEERLEGSGVDLLDPLRVSTVR